MAIFLGKQYLGQKDTIEVEDTDSLVRLDEILKSVKETAQKTAQVQTVTQTETA